MIIKTLQGEIAKIVQENWQLKPENVELTVPRELGRGDFTTNVALKVASRWGIPTSQVVDTLTSALVQNHFIKKNFTKVEAAGPGFVNFFLAPKALYKELQAISKSLSGGFWKGKKIVIEYSSPNIAKPMHVGHLRSTIIGQALVNIYRALGAKVISLVYLGDWGTQFGKLLVAYQKWGSKVQLKRNPIDELLRVYVKFHDELKKQPELEKEAQTAFKNLEEGSPKLKELWKMFRQYSLKEFNLLFKRLGVKFSHLEGESIYQRFLPKIIAELAVAKVTTQNPDGSVVILFDNEKIPPLLVKKSDGASLYATRDLAALKTRVKKYRPSEMLYVVGSEQSLYFDQLFTAAKLAGYAGKTNLQHIKFGFIFGEGGKKMATREGQIIKLEELFNKAVDLAWRVVQKKNPKLSREEKAKVAEVVGLGAVKYNDLSQNRLSDIVFNWNKMLSFEGNSGPYLQYSYVRLKSILAKAGRFRVKRFEAKNLEDSDLELLRKLIQCQDALIRAAKENGPHLLAGYLYELANTVNSYYHDSPVLKASEPLRSLRLDLVWHSTQILKQGLAILGIDTVERM
ncbi:MAG: arginine--tRNA ligase [Patescibacteria group bacterium]